MPSGTTPWTAISAYDKCIVCNYVANKKMKRKKTDIVHTFRRATLLNTFAGPDNYPGVFIRAPGIKSIDSDGVEVLASLQVQGNPV